MRRSIATISCALGLIAGASMFLVPWSIESFGERPKVFKEKDIVAAGFALLGGGMGFIVLGAVYTPRALQAMRCRRSAEYRYLMMADLDSPSLDVRRRALQTLVDYYRAPVGHIDCWPWYQCTYLQMRVMEAMLLRWLEVVEQKPNATEEEIVDGLFEFTLDEDAPEEAVVPPLPTPILGEELNELGEAIKDAMLDWTADAVAAEAAAADVTAKLGPFDRPAFTAAMAEKMAETVEQVAEVLNQVQTSGELAACEAEVGERLANLGGEALALALEMRGLEKSEGNVGLPAARRSRPRRIMPDTPCPPARPFPGHWVKTYRRMHRPGV
jgi:hypothetical protein